MTPQDRQLLATWLAAESAERDAEAETALARLFARLPRPEPVVGFADQVLAIARPVSRARRALPWLAAAALLALLAVPLRLPTLVGALTLIGPGEVAGFVSTGVVTLAELMPQAVTLWRVLGDLQRALVLLITTPEMLSILLVAALTAALGYRVLHAHLTAPRSFRNAQTLSLAS